MSADENRGTPLVSHRIFNDTFAFSGLNGETVVVSREDAIEIVDKLAHLLESDSPPSRSPLAGPTDPPPGVQTS